MFFFLDSWSDKTWYLKILGFMRSCGIHFLLIFFFSFYGIKLNLKENQWGRALMTSIKEVMFSPVWRISTKIWWRTIGLEPETDPITSGADTDKRNGSRIMYPIYSTLWVLNCLFFFVRQISEHCRQWGLSRPWPVTQQTHCTTLDASTTNIKHFYVALILWGS